MTATGVTEKPTVKMTIEELIVEVENEILQTKADQSVVNAPYENKLRNLRDRLTSLVSVRRGNIERCNECHASIYLDGVLWRSIYSEHACCLNNSNGRNHSPRPTWKNNYNQ